MVIGFIISITVADRLVLKFLWPTFHDPFTSIIISIILIPFFILIFVLAINAELIRVSLNLINNESYEFKIKLDKQTKKFSLISSLLGLLLSFSPVLLYLFLIYSGLNYSIGTRIFLTHDRYFIFFCYYCLFSY
jgi:RsiW-degrading membrane proteinase PrsW (M82 family)